MPRLPVHGKPVALPAGVGKEVQSAPIIVFVEGKARLVSFEQLVAQAIKHIPHSALPAHFAAPPAHLVLCHPAAGMSFPSHTRSDSLRPPDSPSSLQLTSLWRSTGVCPDGDAMQTFDWPSNVPGACLWQSTTTAVPVSFLGASHSIRTCNMQGDISIELAVPWTWAHAFSFSLLIAQQGREDPISSSLHVSGSKPMTGNEKFAGIF